MNHLTPRQELRSMEWIAKRVLKLSPAGQRWLYDWTSDKLGMRGLR